MGHNCSTILLRGGVYIAAHHIIKRGTGYLQGSRFRCQDRDTQYPVGKQQYEYERAGFHYSNYRVCPTCGLASDKALIGEVDDARYFDHPERYTADILWFTKGFVEYNIPNFIPSYQKITQLTLSAELCSEAPGVNNVWPSDISFYINDVCVGSWLSPGDFGDSRGLFTPDWWFPNWNQYGMLKLLVINKKGSCGRPHHFRQDLRQLRAGYQSQSPLRAYGRGAVTAA